MLEAFTAFAKTAIESYGYAGIFIMTTLEQFIFPIPADVFLVMGTASGLLLNKMLILVLIAALLGAIIGYFLGRWLGHPIVKWMFGQKRLDEGEVFIRKWGMWGVIIAGLTPLPFKIVTWTAGIFEMPFWRYLPAVIIGRMPRYIITAYAGVLFMQYKTTTEMSVVILGVTQGLTEFLPISSSGHLVVMEEFLHLPIAPENLALFDIFLHGGSLLAIVIYFWRDWLHVLKEFREVLSTQRIKKDSLFAKLTLGTLPAIATGLFFADLIEGHLRNLTSVALFFIAVSLFFLWVEWKGRKSSKKSPTLKKAFIIGCAQALALIPGISRAGMTIGTGMLAGLNREAAARFSFLIGGIAIFAANVYALLSLADGALLPDLKFTLIGFGTSFLISFGAIYWLMKYLRKHSLLVFSFYLMVAGASLLSFF